MKKKNIPYQIAYLLFILFFMAGALFYRQSFLAILLILVCVLPIISIYLTIALSSKIDFRTKVDTPSVNVGNKAGITVTIDNPTIIPFLNCEISFTLQNLFYPNNHTHQLNLSAPAKKTHEIVFPIETCHCGICEIDFTKIEITDFLHLYTVDRQLRIVHQIPVLPDEKKQKYPLFTNLWENDNGDDDEYLQSTGQQSYDIKELREFRPGDRQNLIHWKMSSKTDDLLVKELEKSADHILLIMPEFEKSKLDDTMTTLWSYIKFLLYNKEVFKICLYNDTSKELSFRLITNEDEGYECLLAAMFMPSYISADTAAHYYNEMYGDEQCVIVIVGESIKER